MSKKRQSIINVYTSALSVCHYYAENYYIIDNLMTYLGLEINKEI